MKAIVALFGTLITVMLVVIAYQLWAADQWSVSDCEYGTFWFQGVQMCEGAPE